MSFPLGMVWYFMPEDALYIRDLLKKPLCQNHFNLLLVNKTTHFTLYKLDQTILWHKVIENAPKPVFLRENPTLAALASHNIYICM